MNLRLKQDSMFAQCYFLCLRGFFFFLLFQVSKAQTQNATTDPSEVAALNSILQQWDAPAVALWNISGEPCSGSAINGTEFEDPANNPSIKCDCTYENATVCHITKFQLFRGNLCPIHILPQISFREVMGRRRTSALPSFPPPKT